MKNTSINNVSVVLGCCVIALTGIHFWPFDSSKIWRLFCPANTILILWLSALIICKIKAGKKLNLSGITPHLSLLALIVVNILSISYSQSPARAVCFTCKLILTIAGGYSLFSMIAANQNRNKIYIAATAALVIALAGALLFRTAGIFYSHGFFSNPYKFGNFIAILTPLCCGYLLCRNSTLPKYLAVLIIISAFYLTPSMGAAIALLLSVLAFVLYAKQWIVKILLAGCLVIFLTAIFLFNGTPVKNDFSLTEVNTPDLRQRYIQWQAFINIAEKRTIAGTGAGCSNDYRSKFYYRLPKLNTIQPFDQNGWLGILAETGITGLLCFCWVIGHHLNIARKHFVQHRTIISLGNFTALLSACVVHTFSSLNYNGILIIFILVLAMINKSAIEPPEARI